MENGQKAWTDNFQSKEFKWHAKLPAWLLIKEMQTKMKCYSLVNHETSGGESHAGSMYTVTTGRKWPEGSTTAFLKPTPVFPRHPPHSILWQFSDSCTGVVAGSMTPRRGHRLLCHQAVVRTTWGSRHQGWCCHCNTREFGCALQ